MIRPGYRTVDRSSSHTAEPGALVIPADPALVALVRTLPGLIRRVLADQLFGPAAALMASTALTGLLGVVFWVLAARLYPAAEVGRASAVVSGLLTVSGLAQLELYGVLTKFLPLAGRGAGRLLTFCYGLTVVLSLLLAIGFVAVAPVVSIDLRPLRSPLLGGLFLLGVCAWGVFVLQDGALAGLRRFYVVPVENLIFSISKALLLPLAVGLSAAGVVGAYLVPVIVGVVAVNVLLFRRYLPAHIKQTDDRRLPPLEVFRFARWDVVASWATSATAAGIPLLVIHAKGAQSTGVFFAAWSMVSVIDLLALNLGVALVVDSGYQPGRLESQALRSGFGVLMVLVPVTVAVALAAPLLLSLFGSAYAEGGTGLLRCLAFAAMPRCLLITVCSASRAAGQPARAAAIMGGVTALSFLAVAISARSPGLTPLGWAWFAANTAAAIIIVPSWWWRLSRRVRIANSDVSSNCYVISDSQRTARFAPTRG